MEALHTTLRVNVKEYCRKARYYTGDRFEGQLPGMVTMGGPEPNLTFVFSCFSGVTLGYICVANGESSDVEGKPELNDKIPVQISCPGCKIKRIHRPIRGMAEVVNIQNLRY